MRLQSAVLKPRCVWEANYKLQKALRGDAGAWARRFGLSGLRLRGGSELDNVRGLQVPRSNASRPQSGTFAPARRGRGLWGGAATILEREAEQSRLGATERAAAAAMNPE